MTKNNFDNSSTGINIEGNFYYDTIQSQQDFEDNFLKLRDDLYLYTSNGEIEDTVVFTIKGEREDLIKYLYDTVGNGYEWEEDDDKELIKDIIDNNVFTLENFKRKTEELKEYNISLIPDEEIELIITKGYSQGDYSEVYYFPNKVKQLWGRDDVTEKEIKTIVDNTFWDTPIYGNIIINDIEYQYENDPYQFEREKFINSVVNGFKDIIPDNDLLRSELEKVVPEEIDYI